MSVSEVEMFSGSSGWICGEQKESCKTVQNSVGNCLLDELDIVG